MRKNVIRLHFTSNFFFLSCISARISGHRRPSLSIGATSCTTYRSLWWPTSPFPRRCTPPCPLFFWPHPAQEPEKTQQQKTRVETSPSIKSIRVSDCVRLSDFSPLFCALHLIASNESATRKRGEE